LAAEAAFAARYYGRERAISADEGSGVKLKAHDAEAAMSPVTRAARLRGLSLVGDLFDSEIVDPLA